MSSKKANAVKKPISKNITPHTTSLIKQIKSSALAQKNKMKFISNPVSSNKSKSRSKSNHKLIFKVFYQNLILFQVATQSAKA